MIWSVLLCLQSHCFYTSCYERVVELCCGINFSFAHYFRLARILIRQYPDVSFGVKKRYIIRLIFHCCVYFSFKFITMFRSCACYLRRVLLTAMWKKTKFFLYRHGKKTYLKPLVPGSTKCCKLENSYLRCFMVPCSLDQYYWSFFLPPNAPGLMTFFSLIF